MIFEKVQAIIAEQLGIDEEEVTLESNLEDDLKADSIDFVEILIAIEAEFVTDISDEDAEGFETVEDIVDYLKFGGNEEII